jgi:hypothetical protein
MALSTGPVLAIGAVTLANHSIFHDEPIDWKIVAATGMTALLAGFMEKGAPRVIPALAWVALLTVSFARVDRSYPSPAESALAWMNTK